MSPRIERRDKVAARVPYQTLVEVCGQEPGTPLFEARSVEISGRGLHVRTDYIPSVGTPLILRFEDRGREVLAECEVAWATSGEKESGEFGVRFTGLDEDSMRVLDEVCAEAAGPEPVAEPAKRSSTPVRERGSAVRLHVDGLTEPMRAKVRTGTSQTLNVGQRIDFLQVGRHLEVEARGDRVGAQIDAVHVVIDPRTRVPQLVVTLRYDKPFENTPQPAVVDAREAAPVATPDKTRAMPPVAARPARAKAPKKPDSTLVAASSSAAASASEGAADLDVLPLDESAIAKVGAALAKSAQVAGSHAWIATKATAKVAGQSLRGVSSRARVKLRERRAKRRAPKPRITAPPPGGLIGTDGQRVAAAPQSGLPLSERLKSRKARAAMAVGGAALSIFVVASLVGGPADEAADGSDSEASAVAMAPDGSEMARTGAVVVDVPLFGSVPMAANQVPLDVDWIDVKPGKHWGKGKLKLPVTHSIGLKGAKKSIKVSAEGSFLRIIVPGAKLRGTNEELRAAFGTEKRIQGIRSAQNAKGVFMEIAFKDEMPPFRVRLRDGALELRVSR